MFTHLKPEDATSASSARIHSGAIVLGWTDGVFAATDHLTHGILRSPQPSREMHACHNHHTLLGGFKIQARSYRMSCDALYHIIAHMSMICTAAFVVGRGFNVNAGQDKLDMLDIHWRPSSPLAKLFHGHCVYILRFPYFTFLQTRTARLQQAFSDPGITRNKNRTLLLLPSHLVPKPAERGI
jgi:hypothetical protein